ncbi:MAG: hypothetical protein WD036_12390 [Bauldia sp.]
MVSLAVLGTAFRYLFGRSIDELIFGTVGDWLRILVGEMTADQIVYWSSTVVLYAVAALIVIGTAWFFFREGKRAVSAPAGNTSVEWLPLKTAAQIVYDATRHTLISGITLHGAKGDEAEIIRQSAETVFHRAKRVRGKLPAAQSFDEIVMSRRGPLHVSDDIASVGHNFMDAPEFCAVEVRRDSVQGVIDYLHKIDTDLEVE